jgi:hypothetical protein
MLLHEFITPNHMILIIYLEDFLDAFLEDFLGAFLDALRTGIWCPAGANPAQGSDP